MREPRLRPSRRLALCAALAALGVLPGCQLLLLPFKLVGALLGIALKLVPLVPLFIYEPTPARPHERELLDDGGAVLALVDRRLEQARGLDEESELPALGAEGLVAAGETQARPIAVILVPAAGLGDATALGPMVAQLHAAGYGVVVGDMVDAAPLCGDDLLPQARFLRDSSRLGLTVVAPEKLRHLRVGALAPEAAALLDAALPAPSR